ncbi:hypothetical protein [Microbacterium sp. NPDC057650]|uniref:hypothetical protein n=1 Tax=unclassified Microbacterium TaxID=2609290 RepID=UPI003672A42D
MVLAAQRGWGEITKSIFLTNLGPSLQGLSGRCQGMWQHCVNELGYRGASEESSNVTGEIRVRQGLAGMTEVVLESADLQVVVLPWRGGEINRFYSRALDLDVLYRDRGEMARFEEDRRLGRERPAAEYAFGGLLTMYPNAGEPSQRGEHHYAFHGDARSAPWDYEIVQGATPELRLRGTSAGAPFAIDRTMRFAAGSGALEVTDVLTRTDDGDDALPCGYGIHPYFGPSTLASGTRLFVDDRLVGTLGDDEVMPHRLDCVEVSSSPSSIAVDSPGGGSRLSLEFDSPILDHVWVWLTDRWETGRGIGALIPTSVHGVHGVEGAERDGLVHRLHSGESVTAAWSMQIAPLQSPH